VGYEIEAASISGHAGHGEHALTRRWHRANERLAAALREYAAVRRMAAPGEPEWVAAQLRVAEARQRWRECAEEAERLAEFADGADPFR
jgi:sugar-specific transcriptional regulator TrmB